MATENKASFIYPEQFIKNLYSSGRAAYLTFDKSVQDKEIDEKLQFRQHIIKDIQNNESKRELVSQQELLSLFKLLCFIQVWADPEETWINTDDEYRKKRQLLKFKKNIPKSTRRSIHLGLFKLVYEILLQFKQAAASANDAEEKEFIKNLLESFEQPSIESNGNRKFKKKSLINAINIFLKYKKFNSTPENIEENFSEATKLISRFSVWTDKLFYGCGVGIEFISALACGLSTGGAIFVLLIGFSWPLGLVIPLSLLIFFAGTRSNFQLFSQHISPFLQDLCRNGTVAKFIDQQGKRLQLSRSKKFLLFPAGFFSISVGIATAAITYLEGTKMIAVICPALIVACPHLSAVLLSILASALLIGLTIVMFRTFIGVLQSQFSWQEIKLDVKEKWHNLNAAKGLGYVFKVCVMGVAFFGLGYLDFIGTSTLTSLLGWVAADGITLAAIIGDLPFTLITALAWCNSLFKSSSNPSSDLPKDIAYYLWKIVEFSALIVNALGNAALVFTDSCVSRIASIACFINSYVSNCMQEDDRVLVEARVEATKKSLASLMKLSNCAFFGPSSGVPKETNDVEGYFENGLSKSL
ncbi:MAG: hypothetical protein WAW84_00755 [Candidatus Rickettsiella isopodorum]